MTLCAVNVIIVCMTIWMPEEINSDVPLYRALADAIERDVSAGVLLPGRRLPTHRELADALGVNVSTVTRGYREAERRGLLSGTVGRGTFVSADAETGASLMGHVPAHSPLLELGLVTPLHSLEPDVGACLGRLSRRKDLGRYLRYNSPSGLPEHRAAGALWARRYNLAVQPEDVVVCAGAQHGLNCALTALFRPGDRIATDSLTYPGLKSLAAMLGILLVPVPMDGEGMLPEGLDTACRRGDIRGLYLMPGFQNPTTVTMSGKRRDAVAEVALRHNLLLVEDDAYALTREESLQPVSARMPESAVTILGVSKAFAAGLRVAFAVVPRRFRGVITEAVLNTVWMAPALGGALVAEWISDGTADRVIAAKRAEAARRVALAREMLPGGTFAGADSGYYIWLSLPAPWTGKDFEARGREAGINIFCAEKFAVGGTPAPAAVRVSLTGTESMAELKRGLTVISELLSGTYPEVAPVM